MTIQNVRIFEVDLFFFFFFSCDKTTDKRRIVKIYAAYQLSVVVVRWCSAFE